VNAKHINALNKTEDIVKTIVQYINKPVVDIPGNYIYISLKLQQVDKNKLVKVINDNFISQGDDFTVYCDHVTLHFGMLKNTKYVPFEKKKFIIDYAIYDKNGLVFVVKDLDVQSKVSHITGILKKEIPPKESINIVKRYHAKQESFNRIQLDMELQGTILYVV
jgi:hypothetical protein